MSHVLLAQGDAMRLPLQDGCVQTCICSPPYWEQRDYGTAQWVDGDPACVHSPADTPGKRGLASSTLSGGKQTTGHQREGYQGTCKRCGAVRHDRQLGLEATVDEYLATMVTVFREVKRVLRPDGVLWCNVGDKMVNKQLLGLPWKLAFALQADGWILRSEVIWHKINPMPESCGDRPTHAHEQVFLFAKHPRYFIDMHAIREPNEGDGRKRGHQRLTPKVALDRATGVRNNSSWYAGQVYDVTPDNHRNARDVWSFCSEGFSGAHHATFPTALASRCILASTPQAGCCPQCHTPYQRQVEDTPEYAMLKTARQGTGGYASRGLEAGNRFGSHTPGISASYITTGFAPGCACIADALADGRRDPQHMDWLTTPVPSLVLDPFSGSSTTILTARALGRHGVGVELSWEYLKLSRERLGLAALQAWEEGSLPTVTRYDDLPLFTAPEEST